MAIMRACANQLERLDTAVHMAEDGSSVQVIICEAESCQDGPRPGLTVPSASELNNAHILGSRDKAPYCLDYPIKAVRREGTTVVSPVILRCFDDSINA